MSTLVAPFYPEQPSDTIPSVGDTYIVAKVTPDVIDFDSWGTCVIVELRPTKTNSAKTESAQDVLDKGAQP